MTLYNVYCNKQNDRVVFLINQFVLFQIIYFSTWTMLFIVCYLFISHHTVFYRLLDPLFVSSSVNFINNYQSFPTSSASPPPSRTVLNFPFLLITYLARVVFLFRIKECSIFSSGPLHTLNPFYLLHINGE